MIAEIASGPLSTLYGTENWSQHIYWDGYRQSIALVYGEIHDGEAIRCRIHSSCITAHVFWSDECDCREQMAIAMSLIVEAGSGIVIWLDQEGRGNGMMAHVQSQELKRNGLSQSAAYEQLGYLADSRTYDVAKHILKRFEVRSVVVISNNPDKIDTLRQAGIPVVVGDERAMIPPNNPILRQQYRDKIQDGHILTMEGEDLQDGPLRRDSPD